MSSRWMVPSFKLRFSPSTQNTIPPRHRPPGLHPSPALWLPPRFPTRAPGRDQAFDPGRHRFGPEGHPARRCPARPRPACPAHGSGLCRRVDLGSPRPRTWMAPAQASPLPRQTPRGHPCLASQRVLAPRRHGHQVARRNAHLPARGHRQLQPAHLGLEAHAAPGTEHHLPALRRGRQATACRRRRNLRRCRLWRREREPRSQRLVRIRSASPGARAGRGQLLELDDRGLVSVR
jgi:hypothetical protein